LKTKIMTTGEPVAASVADGSTEADE
jgi:hypothetical protein